MNNKKLNNYLIRLEKALASISISEKADIITEINSHILESTSENNLSIEEVLKRLGEPEQVASRYLLERGLTPQKAPKHPIFKWMVIFALGSFAIFTIVPLLFLLKFSPIVDINEEQGTVKILGGLINVDGDTDNLILNNLKNSSIVISDNFKAVSTLNTVDIQVSNSKLKISNNNQGDIKYKCKIPKGSEPTILKGNSKFKLDLSKIGGSKCEVTLPKDIDINIDAGNAKIVVNEFENNIKIDAGNGKVSLEPKKNILYNYDLNVGLGIIDNFESSKKLKAYKVFVDLGNGKIDNSSVF